MTPPQKTRIYQNHTLDSTRWDKYQPRPDDIIIATAYKSGTTWAQSIVRELIVRNMEETGADMSQAPKEDNKSSIWFESRFVEDLPVIMEMSEAQKHRRFFKSHIPLDAFDYHPQVKYLIIGRDARDVFMSLWNHYRGYTQPFIDFLNNGVPGRVGEPLTPAPNDIHEFYRGWMNQGWFPWESDGYPFWGNMYHTKSFWEFRHLPNIGFFHYADMLEDPVGEIKEIAQFLDIEISDAGIQHVAETTSLEAMRQRASRDAEWKMGFKDGAQTFFFKGSNGRWREVLTEEELAMYEAAKQRNLTPDAARWLEEGKRALG